MKITKYSHACFVIENEGQSLVVDPGKWSNDFIVPENVVAVFVTHEHEDHMDRSKISAIVDENPDVVIAGHQDVVSKLEGLNTQSVKEGDVANFGSFALEFFGGQHAIIAPDKPSIANLGLLINEYLYYGGDSFVSPGKPVAVVALPVSAPWMKYSEAVEYIQRVKPNKLFPTHDAILSDEGKDLADRMVSSVAEKIGAHYERLPFAKTVDI